MEEEADLVTVVVPCFDVERFLPDAVRSVLGQTWTRLEVVLVDDGSRDGTGALADRLAREDPRVRVIHKPNGGLSSARNAGLAAARGELACFLDADDVLLPDKLARQVAFLRLFPACDLVYSDHYVGDERLTPLFVANRSPPQLPIREILVYRNWFAPLSPLARTAALCRVGGFDEGLTSSEDWDFWIRASRCCELAYLPGPVGVYRTHGGQMHRNRARMTANRDRVIAQRFTPGSEAWRAARASRAWMDAHFHWGRREWLRTAARLGSCVWHARSRRTLKNIATLIPG
jgi:glycosyltransferase involved in cell wall biosynthesis